MPAEMPVTLDILNEDAVFILQCLRENAREGRSMHMMDVRGHLADSVTLEFRDYLKFLRKYGYVALDREEHTLSLTEAGVDAAQQDDGQLDTRLAAHFAEKLAGELVAPEETLSLLTRVDPGPPLASFQAPQELVYSRGEVIGQGPVGTVSAAQHTSLGLTVAVKELRADTLQRHEGDRARLVSRLQAVVGAQARLRHPAIVGVYDLDVTVPQPFVVLELCEGGSLRERLRAGRLLDVEHAVMAFGQLLSALALVHDEGLVHQGLKAENLLFDRYGNAKLADLGFARLLSFDDGQQVVDSGIVSYLAPELLQPGAVATPASDVYAAGILLYELLTGRVPGRRSPVPSQAAAGAPAGLDDLFERMVADRVEDRYESAAEVLEEFQAAFPDGRWGQPGQVWLSTRRLA